MDPAGATVAEVDSALILRAKARLLAEQKKIDAACAEDPLFWLQNHTRSFDDQAAHHDPPLPTYRPFPKIEYFTHLFRLLHKGEVWNPTKEAWEPIGNRRVFVAKSRQMLGSWCACGYGVWLCMWGQRKSVLAQCLKEEKSAEMCLYAGTLYNESPLWMRQMHPLKGGATTWVPGRGVQAKNMIVWENGSRFQGVPGGADQIRSFHPFLLISDESAFQPEFSSCYDAANPACPYILCVSSAAPGPFAEMVGERE